VKISYGLLHSLSDGQIKYLKRACFNALTVSDVGSRLIAKQMLMDLGIIQRDHRGSTIAIQKVLIELRRISPDPEMVKKEYKKPVPTYMLIVVDVLDVVPFPVKSPLHKYQEFFYRLGKMSFQVEKGNSLYEDIIEEIQFNPHLNLIYEKPIW